MVKFVVICLYFLHYTHSRVFDFATLSLLFRWDLLICFSSCLVELCFISTHGKMCHRLPVFPSTHSLSHCFLPIIHHQQNAKQGRPSPRHHHCHWQSPSWDPYCSHVTAAQDKVDLMSMIDTKTKSKTPWLPLAESFLRPVSLARYSSRRQVCY